MNISDPVLEKHLASTRKVTAEELDRLLLQARIEKKSLQEIALRQNVISEAELAPLEEPKAVTSPQPAPQNDLTKVIPFTQKAEPEEEPSEENIAEGSPTAQTVNVIIEKGIRAGASDIHLEPHESYVSVRYRIDGGLREANKLPKKVLNALVSRIKVLANLNVDEQRAPQEGRFKLTVNNQVYSLRTSTLPIIDGEKIVLKLLNESAEAATLEQLGYWGLSLKNIQKALVQPHGMVLLAGPVGSGKSTSLYSMLSMLRSPLVNIATVEDPVEYRITGANQTQVNVAAGMSFSNGLRALLRQDPNIIMVGEIYDSETADLAIQAAATGHLVFSTVPTTSAAAALIRLSYMGIEPFLTASTVRTVIGQRLVRKLCVSCREAYEPDQTMLQKLDEIFRISNPAVMKDLHILEIQAHEAGISNEADLSTTDNQIVRMWRAHETGCEQCDHTGYKGRCGVYEVLDCAPSIQKLIIENATKAEIQDQALKNGMVAMVLDGFIKALCGQTTIDEILRWL